MSMPPTPKTSRRRYYPMKLPPQEIAALLGETEAGPIEAIARIRQAVGSKVVRLFLDMTFATEASGGIRTRKSERRRTVGGVFFSIVKRRVRGAIRDYIFHGGPLPEKPGRKPPKQSPVALKPPITNAQKLTAPASLAEAVASVPEQLIRGDAHVKLTLAGTPKQIVERETYVAFEMLAKVPSSLPKGLPRYRKSP